MFDIVKYHSINNSIRIFNNIFFCQHINDIITRTELRIRKIIINQKEYFYKNLKAFFKFKILMNFFNLYENLINKKLFIIKVKLFIFLKNNNLTNKEYIYKNIISKEIKNINITKFKLKCSTNKNKRINIINYKNYIYLILIPSLVKYINKIIVNKKIYIFNILKETPITINFYYEYKNVIKKEKISNKKDLIQYLKNNINNENKIIISNNIYSFLRKLIFKKIIKIIKQEGQLIKLANLLKITLIHKDLSYSRYLLKIIKKWRFLTFIKIIHNKKMSIIYNDLHSGYIDLVNNIVEENPLTKSQIDKMSRLDMKQYLNNFEDPLIIKNNELNIENIIKKKNNILSIKNFDLEYIDDSINFNRKISLGDSMEKDISLIETKFIKDNVNYLYKSYEDNLDN